MPNVFIMCAGKVRYGSRKTARRALERQGHPDWRIYDCPYCPGFHVTSKVANRATTPAGAAS